MSWAEWEDRTLLIPRPWIAGQFLGPTFPALSWLEGSRLFGIGTHAGTTKVWRPLRLAKAPAGMRPRGLRVSRYEVLEEDFFLLADLATRAELIDFVDGVYVSDYFPGAVAGSGLLLTRPLAAGVAGVTEGTHPTKVYLDGVETPAAAAVAGQSVTPAQSGDLRIEYVPRYTVMIGQMGASVEVHNRIDGDVLELTEVVQGSFA